jgi:hypothetical protein
MVVVTGTDEPPGVIEPVMSTTSYNVNVAFPVWDSDGFTRIVYVPVTGRL